MNVQQQRAVEDVLTSLLRLEAMLDMIGLGVEVTTDMNLIECAIDGAADFSRTISRDLHAVISQAAPEAQS